MLSIKRIFLCLALPLILVGCASNQAPQIAYEDKSRPLKDTAVILADKVGKGYDLKITHIDDKPTSCFEVGCPVWVRVTPGKHKVTVRYQGNYQLTLHEIKYIESSGAFEVNAEAGHVYIVEYKYENDRLYFRYRDDGKNSNAGVYLGLSQEKYPVRFD
ncbi:hypothetical protein EDC30_1301 [Paucimonas lemoignei]|uniref:Lipoprotein n=1 Tax=Paucimonas lemoignei TaxID=29443 RepID=A0A4R3HRV7_PAULE|nr:hypothetical protein EDC30_1301 [Paucimonas lemoignei]